MTAPLSLDHIRSLHAGITPGPEWVVNNEEQTVRALHPDGGMWCGEIIFDRSGSGRTEWAAEKPLAAFIAAAPSIVAQLLAVVEAVTELHKPVKKWEPYEGAGYTFATREEALRAAGEEDLGAVAMEAGPQPFEVCNECSRVESEQLVEIGEEWGYRESLWPCKTITAITREGGA